MCIAWRGRSDIWIYDGGSLVIATMEVFLLFDQLSSVSVMLVADDAR
jgi:hypothetical protein